MSTVFLCSPTNSQMFTTCCEVAICDDETKCPRCRQDVTPTSRAGRWEAAYGRIRRGGWYGNWRPGDRVRDRVPDSAPAQRKGGE